METFSVLKFVVEWFRLFVEPDDCEWGVVVVGTNENVVGSGEGKKVGNVN